MSRWSDADLLRMLEMRDGGASAAAIGKTLKATRNAIIGALNRIDNDTEPSEHDGTLPYGWWREGLETQAAVDADPAAWAERSIKVGRLMREREAALAL